MEILPPATETSAVQLVQPEMAAAKPSAIIAEREISALVDSFQKTDIDAGPPSDLVDTPAAVANLVDSLADLPSSVPSLYIDLEGVYLSRHGSISILQLLVLPSNQTYLLDVHTLGDRVFSTPGANGQTLKEILESETILKVFFDVRNDSDALFSHFQIKLAGIQDLQLMELATRTFSRRNLNGLSKCIERDLSLTRSETQAWKQTKEKGLKLFAPERGGSYEVFNTRPLSSEIRMYCIQDVLFMPKLWLHYKSKLTPKWTTKVQQATKDRVNLSQSKNFNGKGQHMALGPVGW